MIHVSFSCTEPEGCLRMQMNGHAGSGPKGKDLACAGASTLVYTLGEVLERMYLQKMLRRSPKVVLTEGRAEIEAVPRAEYFQEALLAFWMTEVGLYTLGMQFPRSVRMDEVLKVAV